MNMKDSDSCRADVPVLQTGSMLTTRLLYSMRRGDLKCGGVTLCIGSGQGTAPALESF